MTLYLIRHTRVQMAPGICYGQSDVPLADTFDEEAAAVLRKLPGGNLPVFSSPLSRCTRLAAQIAPSYQTDARLMELNFGEWEMRAWDDIDRAASEKWMEDFVNRACPVGESFAQMARRVQECAEQIARHNPQGAILVTHAGVIRIFYCLARGKPLDRAFEFQADYGGLFTVNHDGETFCNFQTLAVQ